MPVRSRGGAEPPSRIRRVFVPRRRLVVATRLDASRRRRGPPPGCSPAIRSRALAMSAPTPPPAADPGDAWIGRVVGGHYRIEARLGAGASGVVYRATHTLLEQDFAVKVLS